MKSSHSHFPADAEDLDLVPAGAQMYDTATTYPPAPDDEDDVYDPSRVAGSHFVTD